MDSDALPPLPPLPWLTVLFDPTSRTAEALIRDGQVAGLLRPPCSAAERARYARRHLPPASTIAVDVPAVREYDNYPVVRNIVATCTLTPVSNLSRLAHYLPNVELMADHTSAISIRVDHIMCRFFTTGVLVLTTARTLEQARFEAHQWRLLLERIPMPVRLYDRRDPEGAGEWAMVTSERFAQFADFKVVNIVASGRASDLPLDLLRIRDAYNHSPSLGMASWSPELFPGAKLSIDRSPLCPLRAARVTMHLFDTGRNMIMARHLEDVKCAQHFIRQWVPPYVDPNLPANPMNRFDYRVNRLLHTATGSGGAAGNNTVSVECQALLELLDDPNAELELVEEGRIAPMGFNLASAAASAVAQSSIVRESGARAVEAAPVDDDDDDGSGLDAAMMQQIVNDMMLLQQ